MDGIAAMALRVAELQRQVAPPPATGAFAAVLGSELAGAAAPVNPAAAAAGGTLTLGQMLGLPSTAPVPAATIAAPPSAVPAAGPSGLVMPVEGRFTSGFGMRVHPVTGGHKLHAGVDIAAPTGTPFRAAAAGRVTFAGTRGGYGQLVIVDHGNGTESRYAHASRLDVRVGQEVAAGAALGAIGSTGLSTGPHLHFEFRRGGEPVDPAPLLGLRK